MTVSVADIAKSAFDKVSTKISGVIQTATMTRKSGGTYDPATGTYTNGTATDSGRGVFGSTDAAQDIFPEYVIGSSDELIYLEGFDTLAPKETDELSIGGRTLKVMASRNLLNTGGLYVVMAQ